MKHLKHTLSLGLMVASLHGALAQSQSVQLESTSGKEFRSINTQQVADEITAILAAQDLTAADVSSLTTALNGLTWNDVLANGATSSVDVSLGGNDLSNVARLLAQIISADSLSVTKVIDGQIGSLANHSTDALSEGSTNQYFTLSRSRNAITLSDTGGDGSLTYNGTTGEFTYAGPSASEVRAHFSAGTGVEITGGEVSIGQSVGTADHVTFGSVTAIFTGDLTGDVTGTVSSLSNHTTDALAEGSNLYYTDARAQAAMSGGTGVTVTEGAIAIGQSVEPSANVTFNSVAADLVGDVTGDVTGDVLGNLTGNVTGDLMGDVIGDLTGNVTGNVTGTVSSLSNHTTDALSEGSNLYYTDARAQAAMSGGTGVTVTEGAIAIGQSVEPSANVTFNSVAADLVGDVTGNVTGTVSSLSNHTTDNLAEGSNNLYMTTAERSAIQQMEHALDSLNCTWMKHRGHVYKLVLIEDQCWFAENLQSLVYANGDSILHNVPWWPNTASAGDGAAAVYNEGTPDEAMNLERYGRLYNWYAASDPRNVCPNGWRVGQNEDWETLFINLGMTPTQATSGGWQGSDQGTRIKSSPTDSPAWNGNNTTGFSALPSGSRNRANNDFSNEGVYSYWWSGSTDGDSPCNWRVTTTVSGVNRTCNENPGWGFSIRCIRE